MCYAAGSYGDKNAVFGKIVRFLCVKMAKTLDNRKKIG